MSNQQLNYEAVRKVRRERMRWFILRALDVARPQGLDQQPLLDVIQTVYADATAQELKRELEYLATRELVEAKTDPLGHTYAKLLRYGVDIVEYTVDCEPGIARPAFGA